MELDLDKLEATARAAAPGPWDWADDDRYQAASQRIFVLHGKWQLDIASVREWEQNDDANARHIAACDPTTVLALIAEIRRLRARDAA